LLLRRIAPFFPLKKDQEKKFKIILFLDDSIIRPLKGKEKKRKEKKRKEKKRKGKKEKKIKDKV